MRIIDDKGRVFGKINIFDTIFVTLVIAMIIPAVVFYYQYNANKHRSTTIGEVTYRNTYKYVKANVYLVTEVADYIKKGDKIVDSVGDSTAEIADILYNEPVFFEAEDKGLTVDAFTQKNTEYRIADTTKQDGIYLGTSIQRTKKAIALPSYRRFGVLIKLLCRQERDGSITYIKDNVTLRAGVKVTFNMPDYIVVFAVTDID